jgi:antitoxin component YwqK of YwqJK toxin-antitoxin module
VLENEIEEELKRQEDLLASISKQETANKSIRSEQDRWSASQDSGDPLDAPQAPYERQIPESIFDTERRQEGKQQQLVKTLDADRDGRPEIEMVFDARSGALLTRSDDTDYDGQLDAVNRYEHGKIIERIEDTNGDGEPDRWITYENERGSRMEVDRNFDGTPDAFYVYANGTLIYEEQDTDGDGKIDRRVEFVDRHRSVELEDRDHDGKLESQTFYDKKEIPVRTEQDTNGDSKTDVWEFYEGKDPAKMVLVRKEEDVNADGKVDITSYYEKGKLTRKEVEDPDLLLQ